MLPQRHKLLPVIGLIVLASLICSAEHPTLRKARKDSFFGLHFDLHPNISDQYLGRDVTEAMVDDLLERVRPDYVQYDCKGHVGYLGYPSQVGTSAPGIVNDSLAVWRRVTARRGVSLFIHFSGAWDSQAVKQHPDWATVGPDGKPSLRVTSTFGPYVDRLMIPELKEVSEKYDLDGVWVDGECWAVVPDYSKTAQKAFQKATGLRQLPRNQSDAGWQAFMDVNRQQFRDYVRYYVEVLHAFKPGFQIASNWLYTTYVPELPEIPVDFLSGDFLGNASVLTARLEARYLASVGKPWDLMAWGFQYSEGSPLGINHKSALHLCQEASTVLAQGGGFQVYYNPTRAGKIDERHIQVMARLAEFCRQRQEFCHRTESIPQVGVVFSSHSLYRKAKRLFGGWGEATDPARGMIDALVENHYGVDVIPDWKLRQEAARYPLIVVPDWPDIGPVVRDALVDRLSNGGTVLIVGAENVALFASVLSVHGQEMKEVQSFVLGDEVFGNVSGLWQTVQPSSARILETRFPTYDSTRDGVCAATANRYGMGTVAAIYGPLGSVFARRHTPAVRQFLDRVVQQVFKPDFKVEAPPTVESVLRKKGPKWLLHLINTSGMQVAEEYASIDFVPAVGPIQISIRLPQRPRWVKLEPEGKDLAGKWHNQVWTGGVDSLQVFGTVVFEFE
jgi:hypothetical protein